MLVSQRCKTFYGYYLVYSTNLRVGVLQRVLGVYYSPDRSRGINQLRVSDCRRFLYSHEHEEHEEEWASTND